MYKFISGIFIIYNIQKLTAAKSYHRLIDIRVRNDDVRIAYRSFRPKVDRRCEVGIREEFLLVPRGLPLLYHIRL
jgi:hypothetical protein